MYLSKNGSRSSYTQEDNQNNQRHRDCSFDAAQEELQLRAQILQDNLRGEVPSGEYFQVKCAVKNDLLMILAQHPQSVRCDTDKIFAVLEETLQSICANQEQRVQLFLRVAGVKLPYAKRSLVLRVGEVGGDEGDKGDEGDEGDEGEFFLSPPYPKSPPSPKSSPLSASLLGAALVVIAVLSGCAYLLTRPCVMFECKEIQVVEQLQLSIKQQLRRNSKPELAKVQQQLQAATTSLNTIPPWSPQEHYAKQLSASLGFEAETINQVVKADQIASKAEQKSINSTSNLAELQAQQQMWRQAIMPLEAIGSNSLLYEFVQPKIRSYSARMQIVLQQLQAQEKWLKKLEAAKAVAIAALHRQAVAESLPDWQKVQFTWQVVVNALNVIPRTSPAYLEAQKLLVKYQPSLLTARERATKELLAAKTYDQAVNAANRAKHYEQQNQLSAAVAHWNQALNVIRQIAPDSFYYSKATTLVQPYTTALKQTEEKLRVATTFQKTRTDLNKICFDQIRVCNFIMDNQGITVTITPEYEQEFSSSMSNANDHDPNTVASVSNHLQALQQALEVISENANLPIVLYDTQNREISGHIPGG